ncbi:hypothetical protein M7I_2803 [Glarea lozoyensis 74030]|uniref:Uncharacterized protein n=1 Tax=Glarea lozoyensis (strain ATCC 74030 / MF5533) TaxID=1104152 RepID=H0EJS3_GLAL7|nr:hypothetical protein M7I_2803 [Glarea lozoyensis 74030]
MSLAAVFAISAEPSVIICAWGSDSSALRLGVEDSPSIARGGGGNGNDNVYVKGERAGLKMLNKRIVGCVVKNDIERARIREGDPTGPSLKGEDQASAWMPALSAEAIQAVRNLYAITLEGASLDEDALEDAVETAMKALNPSFITGTKRIGAGSDGEEDEDEELDGSQLSGDVRKSKRIRKLAPVSYREVEDDEAGGYEGDNELFVTDDDKSAESQSEMGDGMEDVIMEGGEGVARETSAVAAGEPEKADEAMAEPDQETITLERISGQAATFEARGGV